MAVSIASCRYRTNGTYQVVQELQFDSAEYWREVVCANILEASCTDLDSDFIGRLTLSHHTEFQLARVSTSRHSWDRTEKHVRHSAHDNLVAYLQVRGTALQVQDGREIYLKEGEWTCADTTRPMSAQLEGSFEQIHIHIPRSVLPPALASTERFTSIPFVTATPMGRVLASFLQSLSSNLHQVSAAAAAQLEHTAASLLMATLAEFSSAHVEHPGWHQNALLYRAKDLIRLHCRNSNLTPTWVAEYLKISVRYLQEIFSSAGVSPSDFIWECRLLNASKDLGNHILSSLSIVDIALRCGFSDAAHFSRRFKNRFQMSPREYRQQNLDGFRNPGAVGPLTEP